MALLQISEPGQSPSPHQFKRAAGIDLGTTNSLVATVRGAQSQVIAAEDGTEILPSAVYYGNAETLVGHAALQQSLVDPDNALTSFKRWMGRGYDDLKDSAQFTFVDNGESLASVKTDAGDVNAIQASSELLSRLAARAESFLGGPLAGVVITVPAYFDDSQRQATRDAAMIAGLEVLRLINEPTAAALAYGIDKQDDRFVAIYDLGGGTFDISILQLSEGVFEVLATGGDASLGGDDFDQAIVDWVLQSSGFSIGSLDSATRTQLFAQARAAKHTLSNESSVKLSLISGQDHWQGELSAEMFVQLIESNVEATLAACRRCLDDAELEPEDIADVVLVGGSTRVPLVRSKVAKLFGQSPRDEVDPDKVVALGAAIQADALVGNEQKQDLLLLDVLPLSLGIETMGGLVEKIISRNTAIPCRMAQEFTTQKDGQTALAIHVLQGERERVSDCRSLARFELRGLPPMVAGAARIKVIFDIDANGLLAVTATEETTNISAEITVQPSSGLKEEQVTEMLKASYQYAEADRDARMLVEQQVDAQALLDSIEAALEADSDLLNVEELAAIQSTIEALEAVKTSDDVEGIRRSIKALSDQTEVFAARRMDKSIKQALTGRSLNDFSSEATDIES